MMTGFQDVHQQQEKIVPKQLKHFGRHGDYCPCARIPMLGERISDLMLLTLQICIPIFLLLFLMKPFILR